MDCWEKEAKLSTIFAYPSVYLGSKEKELYAIKVYFPGPSKETSFKREVDFLSALNFKHLINIVASKADAKVALAGK